MDKIYFTITGTSYRYGTELFEKGDRVMLKKEPDNKYDHEAIQVKVPGLGVSDMWQTAFRPFLGNRTVRDACTIKSAMKRKEK